MSKEVNTLEEAVQSYLEHAQLLLATSEELKMNNLEELKDSQIEHVCNLNEDIINGLKKHNKEFYTKEEETKDKQFYAEELLKVEATILLLSKDNPNNEALQLNLHVFEGFFVKYRY